ncbi:MAG: RNA-binding protein [Parvibaculaceae bacterium]
MSERTCVVTRSAADPEGLLRFVRSPEGSVVPDVWHKLPGRGVWVGGRRALVLEAVKRRLFARGLGADASVPADLPQQVELQLERAATNLLSLANKAGLVLQGFEKVSGAIEKGLVCVLIEASDGAQDGRRKLKNRLASACPGASVVASLDSSRLGLALGRPNVIHAALVEAAGNGLPRKFLDSARRLEAYRDDPGGLQVNVES